MNQMNITVMCPTHHAAAMGQQITMSSREIAKLVDSRHSNVCVTIERLMNSGVIGGYAALQYTPHSVPVLPKFREIGYAPIPYTLNSPISG